MESPLDGFLVGFDPLPFDELSRIKMDQCVDQRPRKEIPGLSQEVGASCVSLHEA